MVISEVWVVWGLCWHGLATLLKFGWFGVCSGMVWSHFLKFERLGVCYGTVLLNFLLFGWFGVWSGHIFFCSDGLGSDLARSGKFFEVRVVWGLFWHRLANFSKFGWFGV